MFKLLEEISGASVSFVFEDVLISAPERATVAGALLCNGFSAIRRSHVSGAERGPFCMMGTCFECLVQNMAQAGVEHVSGATVWNVDEYGTITYSIDSHARKLRGKHIIIASGAIERPVPVRCSIWWPPNCSRRGLHPKRWLKRRLVGVRAMPCRMHGARSRTGVSL